MSGTWRTVDVGGRPAAVYDPPGGRPRFGVLYLHSLAQETLEGDGAFEAAFAEHRLACVCPSGGPAWWVDRACAGFDAARTPQRYLLDDVLPYFAQAWGLRPPGVGLLGVSMGGQGALRLAFDRPETFPVVAALASAVECHELYGLGTALDDAYDSKEQCRQDTAPMHVHPSRHPPHLFFACDPEDADWHRGNDRLREKLSALGVAHECDLTTRAGGHTWAYFDAMAGRAVGYLDAGLREMGRRLL